MEIYENNSIPKNDGQAISDNPKEDKGYEDFSLEGYEVVHRAFFSHLFEPSVKLVKKSVSVNSACIRRLPDTEYVQFMVNRDEKKLVVKSCTESDRDSFRWSSVGKDGKARPRTISCEQFFVRIMKLMDWDPDKRYRIMGKLVRTTTMSLFVFDLKESESFRPGEKATYPEGWEDGFGVLAKEHEKEGIINFCGDDSVFYLEAEEEQTEDYIERRQLDE